jgi:hypothetical protein
MYPKSIQNLIKNKSNIFNVLGPFSKNKMSEPILTTVRRPKIQVRLLPTPQRSLSAEHGA